MLKQTEVEGCAKYCCLKQCLHRKKTPRTALGGCHSYSLFRRRRPKAHRGKVEPCSHHCRRWGLPDDGAFDQTWACYPRTQGEKTCPRVNDCENEVVERGTGGAGGRTREVGEDWIVGARGKTCHLAFLTRQPLQRTNPVLGFVRQN